MGQLARQANVGKPMRGDYARILVAIANKGAVDLGYKDVGAMLAIRL